MSDHFGDALALAVKSKGNPVVVGLDPRFEQLPARLLIQVDVIVAVCHGLIPFGSSRSNQRATR